jgi:Leucine-rich repeat (LRR) protein
LINLRDVDFSNNLITTIPDGLFKLDKLNKLILYNNSIVEISNDITKLTNLDTLNVCDNKLTSIDNLNIKDLYINCNNLVNYNSINRLNKLTVLYLCKNTSEQNNIRLNRLTNLKNLLISFNKLNSIGFEYL